MRPVRAFTAAAALTVGLVAGAGSAAAQTTTTTAPPAGMPGTALPVTGAPAAPQTDELARTGSELVPVVNTAMGLIAAGFALVVGTERRRSARRATASVWSC